MSLSSLPTFFLILVLGLLSPLAQSSDNRGADSPSLAVGDLSVVSLATFNYYPYYENGEGMIIDIYREAFATQGIELVVHILPVMRAVSAMLKHQVDAFTPGEFFVQDKATLELVESTPAFFIDYGMFYKGGSNPFDRRDLHGTTLVTPAPIKAPAPGDQVLLERGAKHSAMENPDRQMRMVISGRAEFASATMLTGWLKLKKYVPQQVDEYSFAKHETMLCTLMFAKSNPRADYLMQAFEKGLKQVIENGNYLKALERYWGEGNVPKDVLPEAIRHQGTETFDPGLLPKSL